MSKKIDFKDVKTQADYEEYLRQHPDERTMHTMSLVCTNAQYAKWCSDMAKVGWKLSYRGHSGSWLGEPIYEVTKDGTNLGQNDTGKRSTKRRNSRNR